MEKFTIKYKMANGLHPSQQQIISHLNNDIYNNGLKFERDRTFRNKLIIKAIVIMAVLLVLVAVLCIMTVKDNKSSAAKKIYNQTKIYKLYNKVPANFDPDFLESVKEWEILQELKTTFIPPPLSYQNVQIQAANFFEKQTRSKRQEFFIHLGMEKLNNTSDKNSLAEHIELSIGTGKFDRIWLTGSDVFQKSIENNTEDFSNVLSEKDSDKPEKVNISAKYERISQFWKQELSEHDIRRIQAEKMKSYMDLTANPCDDFYQYACGNWEKNNPIPEDKAGFDIFEMIRESFNYILRDLLLEPESKNTPESFRKAKNLFESCMDEETLQKRGNEPLFSLVKKLKGWPMIQPEWNSSEFDWLELMAELRLYNHDILLAQWVSQDMKSSTEYIVQFDQSSLGLPTRDYFLQPSNSPYLDAYKTFIIRTGVLLGGEEKIIREDAKDIISFETKLAGITSSIEDRRNISELYQKMSLLELSNLIPQINWIRYLTIVLARKVEPEENVVLFALKYFKDLVRLLDSTPPRTIANYLMWRFMRYRVNNLGNEFQDAKQDFYYILFGREKIPPRWSRCVNQVNTDLGMALGSMFVKRYFDESSKNDTVSMTQEIMTSFKEILNSTEWINTETKTSALEKVNAMILRIGYPDFILNETKLNERYRQVNVSKSLYFENSLNLLRHLARFDLDRLGTTVDKSQWNTPPTTVNAYYSRNKNQIMVPAGILQPPFYHKHFPRSLNYGGIGIVIGHEITHGFDDKGRLFDQEGNLYRWWDEGAIQKFHQKAKCLIDQYSAYTVREIDLQINGVHTQGENIADNGGILQAYRAYERWLKRNNYTDETLPGLNATNFQLFFLNFAQVWCGVMRPEASRSKLKTAIHSPGKFRVIGTLSNSEEFAKAFNCLSNTTMNPEKKCKVW